MNSLKFIAIWFCMIVASVFMPILTLARYETRMQVKKKY